MVKRKVDLLTARSACFVAALLLLFAAKHAGAQTLTSAEDTARDKAVAPEKLKSRLVFSGWIESGFTGNPAGPSDHQNFGRLFDDRSNEFVMNQAVLTAERALDSKAGLDWGFKLQFRTGLMRVTLVRPGCAKTTLERVFIRRTLPKPT